MEKLLKLTANIGIGLGILLSGCLFNSTSAKKTGTGEETTNGIYGRVSHGQGPAAGITVSLFSRNYQPLDKERFWQTRRDTLTDTNGYYRFTDLENGDYNVLAKEADRSLGALLQGVSVSSDTAKIQVPSAVLNETSSLTVSLAELNASAGSHLFIPGTPLFVEITKAHLDQGRVTLSGIPAADYSEIIYLDKPGMAGTNILGSPLSVTSGKSLTLGTYAEWSHSAEIAINTSASGANIKNDLYAFPLLVRLDATNFSFAKASSKGHDLRVTKMDNTPLPFEIESWDNAAQVAIVWVGIDTLKANNSAQTLRLYWGNLRAQSKSNGLDVFTKNTGYSGVWHMNDSSADFTVNESSAQGNAIARRNASEIGSQYLSSNAVIGRGFNFLGDEWIDLGQNRDYLNGQSAATLSGWVKPIFDTTDRQVFGLLNIGVGQEDSSISTRAGVEITGLNSIRARGRTLDFDEGSQSLVAEQNLESRKWIYFTAVIHYAADSISIYLDGTFRNSTQVHFSSPTTENTPSKLSTIGAQETGGYNYLTGQMDEMRVAKGVHSASWIKMCYENQKPGSTVVSLRK